MSLFVHTLHVASWGILTAWSVVGLLTGCLAFPRASIQQAWVRFSVTYPWRSHSVTSIMFYWSTTSHRPAQIQGAGTTHWEVQFIGGSSLEASHYWAKERCGAEGRFLGFSSEDLGPSPGSAGHPWMSVLPFLALSFPRCRSRLHVDVVDYM